MKEYSQQKTYIKNLYIIKASLISNKKNSDISYNKYSLLYNILYNFALVLELFFVVIFVHKILYFQVYL